MDAAFGAELPATVTLDYPTVASLAGYITSHLVQPTERAMLASAAAVLADSGGPAESRPFSTFITSVAASTGGVAAGAPPKRLCSLACWVAALPLPVASPLAVARLHVPTCNAGVEESLYSGKDLVRPAPLDRWDVDGVGASGDAIQVRRPLQQICLCCFRSAAGGGVGIPGRQVTGPPLPLQANPTRLAIWVVGVAEFDEGLFRLSRAEAAALDPQCRHLLERSAAAGQGGMLTAADRASTGVYVGCVWTEYPVLLEALLGSIDALPSPAALTGSGLHFTAGRVSYTFGFQGRPLRSLPAHHLLCLQSQLDLSASFSHGLVPLRQA